MAGPIVTARQAQQAAGVQDSDATFRGATISTSLLALPVKRSWQYLTESAAGLLPSVDGARIYLPLVGGRVTCLDRQTGSLLWSSEPGGIISAPIAVAQDSIYLVTQNMAGDGSDAGASLRAADKATGLTLWARDYPRAFTSPLALGPGRIYAGSSDGGFYALGADNGEVLWKVQTQAVVRGHALVTERAIYFGSDDGALRAIDPADGHEIWKVQTGGRIVGRPAADDLGLYFGSADGYVYSLDALLGKLRWRSRTGAAVEAAVIAAGDRLLAASFDNFIYALSRENGDRIWKRRLTSRVTAVPIVVGDAALVAPLRAGYVAVFSNANGKQVNLYQLEKGFEIVADPVLADHTLLISTDKGLVVTTFAQAAERTNAVKKK